MSLINPLHTEFIWENIFSFSMIINSEMVKVMEIVPGWRLFTLSYTVNAIVGDGLATQEPRASAGMYGFDLISSGIFRFQQG